MYEFDLIKYEKNIILDDKIKKIFNKNQVFFLRNKNDKTNLFIKIGILNTKKGVINYYESYFNENNEKFDNYNLIMKSYLTAGNPHCFIKGKDCYYVFIEGHIIDFPYFFKIDIINNKFYIYTIDDLLNLGMIKGSFSQTPFLFNRKIYMSFLKIEEERELYFLEVSLDLKKVNIIKKIKKKTIYDAPHTLFRYKNNLLYVNFLDFVINCKKLNKKFKDSREYINYVDSYYQGYINFRKKYFQNNIKYTDEMMKDFLLLFGKIFKNDNLKIKKTIEIFLSVTILDIISFSNLTDLKPSFNKGAFNVLDLKTKKIKKISTSSSSPAHIEIDKKGNLYISNHCFLRYHKHDTDKYIMHFFDSATIDKFKVEDNCFKLDGVFKNNTGFRYTTHKVFYSKGKKIICTIGYPNRLFFIDGDTMELIYYYDLIYENNLINNVESNINYLNNEEFLNLGNFCGGFVAINTLKNGIIFITGFYYYIFFDYEKKQIINKFNNEEFGLKYYDKYATVHICET